MESVNVYLAIFACILLFGVALNRFSRFLKMPILICFLGVGFLCGKYGLDLFPKFDMSHVQFFGEIAVAFIIFAGGLGTSFASIKKVFLTGTLLSTAGVVLTALFFSVFLYLMGQTSFWPYCSFTEAILVGAIFSSTDAAAVFAILRGQKAAISPKLQGLLEYESGSNDPAAFLLTTIILGVLVSHSRISVSGISWTILCGILWGLGVGASAGFLFGLFGQWFYNWIHSFLEYNGLRFVVAIAIVALCFGCTNAIFHANSLMACYVAGITMGNLRFNFKQSFIHFHDGVSWLMQIMLFTILGSFFNYRTLFNWRMVSAVLVAAVALMFIVRPLVVMLCMIGSPFTIRERIFTSWVGIRGSAPIMLAALVLATVVQADPAYAQYPEQLFYEVFMLVLLSILVQGSTLMWVAKKLNLVLPYEERAELPFVYEEKADGREMFQFTVSGDNPLAGQELGERKLENEPILLMITRDGQFIQPKPDFVLQKNDTLSFLGDREAMLELHRKFFPNEPCSPSLTFRQVWKEMTSKYSRRRRQRK